MLKCTVRPPSFYCSLVLKQFFLGHVAPWHKLTLRYLGLILLLALWVASMYGMVKVKDVGWKILLGIAIGAILASLHKLYHYNFIPGTFWVCCISDTFIADLERYVAAVHRFFLEVGH